jgi:hypothetical protein
VRRWRSGWFFEEREERLYEFGVSVEKMFQVDRTRDSHGARSNRGTDG